MTQIADSFPEQSVLAPWSWHHCGYGTELALPGQPEVRAGQNHFIITSLLSVLAGSAAFHE